MYKIIFVILMIFFQKSNESCFKDYFSPNKCNTEAYITLDLIFECLKDLSTKMRDQNPKYNDFWLQEKMLKIYDEYCYLHFLLNYEKKYHEFDEISKTNDYKYKQIEEVFLKKLDLIENKLNDDNLIKFLDQLLFDLQKIYNDDKYIKLGMIESIYIVLLLFFAAL